MAVESYLVGKSGRLGAVIARTLEARGDWVLECLDADEQNIHHPNYAIFAHRYRGPAGYDVEMEVNVKKVIREVENITFARQGDCAVVIIGSVCSCDPAMNQSLAYNLSKAALAQLSRFWAKQKKIRCNTVSPATFTGDSPEVTAQQVADVVAFLCSPLASGINGQEIRVTG